MKKFLALAASSSKLKSAATRKMSSEPPWVLGSGGVSSEKWYSHLCRFDNSESFTTDIPHLDNPSKFVCCVFENWLLIRDYDNIEEAFLVNITTREERQLPPITNLEIWSGLKSRCVMTITPAGYSCTVGIFSMVIPFNPSVLIWNLGEGNWREYQYNCGGTLRDLAIWNRKIIGFYRDGLGECKLVGENFEVEFIGDEPPDLDLHNCSKYLVGSRDDGIFLVYTVSKEWPETPGLTNVIIFRLEREEWIRVRYIGRNIFLLSKHSQSLSIALPDYEKGIGIYIAACANHAGYFYDMDPELYYKGTPDARKWRHKIRYSEERMFEPDEYPLDGPPAFPLKMRYEPYAYLLRRRLSQHFMTTHTREIKGYRLPSDGNRSINITPIEAFGPDLTNLINVGYLDPIVGGQYYEEIDQVAQNLGRENRANIPILIGNINVQKTTVVVGLALRIAQGDIPERIEEKQVIILNTSYLIAGRSDVSYVQRTLEEMITNKNILFIGEMHELFGAGVADSAIETTNIMKLAMYGGELQWIGATTSDGYIMMDGNIPQLERSFQPILVPGPNNVNIQQPDRLVTMRQQLNLRVIGQYEAVEVLSCAIHHAQRTRRGNPNRPKASFIFCQPVREERVEFAKALATFYFGIEDAVFTLDMREYKNAGSVHKLIGTTALLGRNDEDGVLTKAARCRRGQVLQFDWIEWAHRDVLDIIYEILEHGCVKNGYGRSITFKRNVIVLNRVTMGGSRGYDKPAPCLSDNVPFMFKRPDISGLEIYKTDLDFLAPYINPGLLNLCDGIILFKQISPDDEGLMENINSFLGLLERSHQVKLDVTDRFRASVVQEVCKRAVDGEAIMVRMELLIIKLWEDGKITIGTSLYVDSDADGDPLVIRNDYLFRRKVGGKDLSR